MVTSLQYNITLVTYFLCLTISLWFAIYLLARGDASPLNFRAVIALIAITFYFNSSFTEMLIEGVDTGIHRSLANLIALVAIHDLTHYLLPPNLREKYLWISRGVILLGMIGVILLLTNNPSSASCPPLYTCPTRFQYPWIYINFLKFLIFIGILANYWLMRQEGKHMNLTLYAAVLSGTSTIVYTIVSTVLNQALPRWFPNLLVLLSLVLLLYTVARNNTFVTHQTSTFEAPITLLTIIAITVIYVWTAFQFRLPSTSTLILALLAIFTHSAYDLVREFLKNLIRKQDHAVRKQLRSVIRESAPGNHLPRIMQRTLAILCHKLGSSQGWMAWRNGGRYEIAASLNSLPTGSFLTASEFDIHDGSTHTKILRGVTYWLVPAYAGSKKMGLIGVGSRYDQVPFDEDDLSWLEDVAAEIGWMIHAYKQSNSFEENEGHITTAAVHAGEEDAINSSQLLSTLAYNPSPDLVKSIEEGFRNLNDYTSLGASPLVALLGIRVDNHIEAGKMVQIRLMEIIEKLRPEGNKPQEPMPKEWFAYIILHDAYVKEIRAREIMAKLYISEGTYFRMRRSALRSVTRVLLERGDIQSTSAASMKPNSAGVQFQSAGGFSD